MKRADRAVDAGGLVRVIARPGAATEALVRALQRCRVRVVADWPMPDPLPDAGDALFCVYDPALPARIPWTPGESPLALIVLIEPGAAPDLGILGACACDAVLAHPCPPELVAATLSVARSRLLYERRLRNRIEKLDENLRAIRTVERAKAILVAERHMTEAEAYAFLRQRAMEKRVTVGAIATAFVDSHSLLK